MRVTAIITILGLGLVGCVVAPTRLSGTEKSVIVPRLIPTETNVSPTSTSSNTAPQETATTNPTPEADPMKTLPGIEIFNFSSDEARWYIVDDDVMGGVSSSRIDFFDQGIMSFSGTMSLENNGGFSSVRSEWKPTELTGSDGVLLKVMGDGKTYRFRIRSTDTGRDITYNAIFKTTPKTWELIYIPFEGMVPTFRGFVMDVEPLDPSKIASFGFMLSDNQPGEFGLLVDWIRAVSKESTQGPLSSN
jgi:monofunctional biosynthetic peptidoglycan transglycosylase